MPEQGSPRTSARTRTLAAAGGWLLAAALATGAGMFAVGAIGADLAPESARPLSDAEVVARANGTTAGTSTPPSSPARRATGSAVLVSRGGTVLAQCAGREVRIASATPAQGYRVDERDDGLEDTAEVKFTGGGTEIKVKVHCVGGVPRKVAEHAAADSADPDGDSDTNGDSDSGDRHDGPDGDDDGAGG